MPISFDDFIKKYKGKLIEYHSYGTGALYQCIDLVNFYFVEVLGTKAIIGTNAVDVPSKVSPDDFTYIKNSPTAVPVKGDVVVWNGTWGHIAIFYEGDVNSFVSFDQNFPTGSLCQLTGHTYQSVLGWLHFKKEPVSDALTECLAQHETLVKQANEKDKKIDDLTKQVTDLDKQNREKDTKILNFEKDLSEWNNVKKAFGIQNLVELDAKISATQTGNLDNYVLKTKYDEDLKSVKEDTAKTETIKCDLKLNKTRKDLLAKIPYLIKLIYKLNEPIK